MQSVKNTTIFRLWTVLPYLCALFMAGIPAVTEGARDKPSPPLGTSPIIILSYPARVNSSALPALEQFFDGTRYPYTCSSYIECPRREGALADTLVKTAYYVLDVYDVLVAEFGQEAVVLQPGTIDVDPSGTLTYEVPDNAIPASVHIDFISAVHPVTYGGEPSFVSTYGKNFMPAYVVSGDPIAYPSNGGLIAISKGLSFQFPRDGVPSALLQFQSDADRKRKGSGSLSPVLMNAKPRTLDENAWISDMSSPAGAAGLARSLIRSDFAAMIASIKSADNQAALDRQITEYAKIIAGADPHEARFSQLAQIFARTERRFLQSVFVDELRNLREGDFGRSVRERLKAERQINSDALKAGWTAALGLAVSGAAGGKTANGLAVRPDMLLLVTKQRNIAQATNETANRAFLGVTSDQLNLVMEIGGANYQINARSVDELRDEFRRYLRNRAK